MQITINGESVNIASGTSLAACLEERGLNPAVVVVELNRRIIPAEEFASTNLAEDDILEILHFVGGG